MSKKPTPPKRVSAPTPPKRHLFSRFADDILAHISNRDPDELLTSSEVASILRVSLGWMDQARATWLDTRPGTIRVGPEPKYLGPNIIRYRLGDVITFLRGLNQTPPYGTVPISSNRGHHGPAVKKTPPPPTPRKSKASPSPQREAAE